MKSLNSFADREQAAAFTLVCRMLAITPLWLVLAAANTCAYAQTFDDVSNSSAATSNPSSPADWTEFHRDNMQRGNPYETTLGIKNTNELKVKWNLLGQHFSPYEAPCNGSFPENLALGATPSPAIANGVAYYGSNDGNLYALNVTTGAKLWSLAKACVESSPTVVDGVVYTDQ
jgi:outer membrane protein assembly factor BamB